MQGGFICKGYNPGPLDDLFGSSCESAIVKFKQDLGMASPDSTLTAVYFKSLLTTDPTLVTPLTNMHIRLVQQFLNNNYSSLFVAALGFIPTNGQFERKTSRAPIYAFQQVIGTTADGVLGPNTFTRMPAISVGSTNQALVKILQCALICSQFVVGLDGVYMDGWI